ncbi:putative callose synthase 6 [Senna tora]|uniref:Putative callose synthase 6 n=1 Tax=Senna tora TaxID=362788 RepID=A0A834T601_9FABA|nr:putative callose synthase 6 [Senna tora]
MSGETVEASSSAEPKQRHELAYTCQEKMIISIQLLTKIGNSGILRLNFISSTKDWDNDSKLGRHSLTVNSPLLIRQLHILRLYPCHPPGRQPGDAAMHTL